MGRNQGLVADPGNREFIRLQQQPPRYRAVQVENPFLARRRNLHAQLRAVQAMGAGRVEADPPPHFPPPQAPNARLAAAEDAAPAHQPGPAQDVRHEPAMDPALIWGRVAPAVQAPASAPAPAVAALVPDFGVAPAPQPQVPGYGMGHMMHFMPFGDNGGLNQAMDQALAQFVPALRRSLPFYNYFGAQVPQDVTNQNPHRPAGLAPEARPVNMFNNAFPLANDFSPFVGLPFEPVPVQAPQYALPVNPEAQHQPDLAARPFEQAREFQHDPIILSSPGRSDLVDLTIEDGNLEAGWR